MVKIVASGQLTITDLNDSKQASLYIGSSQPLIVTFDGLSTYKPNYTVTNQILSPELLISGGDVNLVSDIISSEWSVQVGSAGAETPIISTTPGYTLTPVSAGSKLNKLTIKTNIMANQEVMTYLCKLVYRDPSNGLDTPIKSNIVLQKRANGVDSIVGHLSNTEATIVANSAGTPISYANAKTVFTVYKGGSDDTTNWNVTRTPSAGITVNAADSTTMATITGMTVDAGTVTFTATHKKESSLSSVVTVFTVTKNRNGTDATTYWMEEGVGVIQRVEDGTVLTPASFTMSGHAQTGSSTPITYAGRFKVYESTDGINYPTASYTSAANEATKTYTIINKKNIKSLKIEYFQAGGTTVRLDSQIIPVVENGVDVLAVSLQTPEGDTVYNNEGSVKVEAMVYKGANDVSAAATYAWYVQDSGATIANGQADAAGGAGWYKLTTTNNKGIIGYTTAIITVPGSSFANIQIIKCLISHNSSSASATTIIKDITDPMTCQLIGDQFFKNGQGTNVYKALLYRVSNDGVKSEVTDVSGYVFNWSLLNNSLTTTKVFSQKTQSLTVSASDVNGKGTINVDVTAV